MEASLTLKREENVFVRGIHILKDSFSLHEIHKKSENLLIWFSCFLRSKISKHNLSPKRRVLELLKYVVHSTLVCLASALTFSFQFLSFMYSFLKPHIFPLPIIFFQGRSILKLHLRQLILASLFYYLAYFCYYLWVSLHFLVLFMGFTILFQLTCNFIYSIFSKKFSISVK